MSAVATALALLLMDATLQEVSFVAYIVLDQLMIVAFLAT
jgi:hypothetical protein